jgi:hypothetical protein
MNMDFMRMLTRRFLTQDGAKLGREESEVGYLQANNQRNYSMGMGNR